MSLITIASFDDGAQAYTGRWNTWSSLNNIIAGRTGNAVRLDGNANNLIIADGMNDDTIILGCAFQWGGISSSFSNFAFNEGGSTQVSVRCNGSGFTAYRGTSTVLGSSASGLYGAFEWHYLEIKVVIHDTTGSVEIRLNGSTVLNLTNQDTQVTGNAAVTWVAHGAHSGTTGWLYLDDYYICDGQGGINDDFLGDCKVEWHAPDGNGNYSDWVGQDADSTDNYLNVDDDGSPDDDTTYNEAGTAGDTDSYTHDNLDASSSAQVFGVQVGAIAKHTGGGGTMRLMHRRAGADDYQGTFTPGASYTWGGYIWDQDPQAGPGVWTPANVDASEFGVDIVS
ncbi:MAG: hypothetical protein R3330_08555 [Saprospiraceae bacterium]|nr:hypothetical protein [Saprospiraceae bacterium]